MAIIFQDSYYEIQWDLNSGVLNKGTLDSSYFGSVDDNANGFKLRILQNASILTPTTENVYFYANIPGRDPVYITAIISGDYFIINLTNEVFAVPGPVTANFQINYADKWKTSPTFIFKVESNTINSNIESTDDFIALRDALAQVQTVNRLIIISIDPPAGQPENGIWYEELSSENMDFDSLYIQNMIVQDDEPGDPTILWGDE